MKYYSILLLFMLSCSVNAQKIIVDRIEASGSRQVMADTKEYKVDDAKYKFCLKVYDSRYGEDWVLLVSSFYYMPEESTELLIKLGNGDVLYFPVNNVHVGQITLPGYGVTIGSITTVSPSRQVDHYSAVFAISKDDLDKIDRFGISKVRISNGVKYRDKKISNNSLGKYLSKSREKILDRLNKSAKEQNLYDGF